MDLTTENILEAYDLPKFLDEWNVQQLLKPLLDCGASVQVCSISSKSRSATLINCGHQRAADPA